MKDTEMATECMRRFSGHDVNDDQRIRMEGVRAKAMLLAMEVCGSCSEGRERSLAITRLEEAVFWANASIAREGADGEKA